MKRLACCLLVFFFQCTPADEETLTIDADTPGLYQVHAAYEISVDAAKVKFIVESVEIMPDLKMKFNVGWSVAGLEAGSKLVKSSDADNINMYLLDNLGNRYDHVETGGAALTGFELTNDQQAAGWFLFPPAQGGINLLHFHDDDNQVVIGNIKVSF